ncbi:hypothetical protein SEA_VERITY_83 [Gordonia phage Verity]|uniref:Uncharacterized protein n=2 Tax=Zitchvirus TaxID=2948963 RepID=A0A514DIW6_9CAUD|nr:hypothetical protein J1775_gp84 [Gordonia phage Zipp]YP_010002921.1 hypothetical protein J1776_gp83 [Gordonia phage Verity]QPO16927.1 hypothetical protein SEA_DELREY21_84 [Gordonia phage Delrey21]QXN74210.1 hypothetical protein SEA_DOCTORFROGGO_84 [Gordonia phage DoctorFroggo]QDH93237.1 hypothetical protein SEA_ZIPP_84 [Gordonia phage Zipp]QDH93569.1 hypothetical protein SEA_VERITY_83 [Gordonia phage Verity]
MSRGQRPRWPAFFPRMKVRGKHRARRPRVIMYDEHWRPVWPQPTWIGALPGRPWWITAEIPGMVRTIRIGAKLVIDDGPPLQVGRDYTEGDTQ